MDITIQQVIEQIDSSPNRAFIVHFSKVDGSIRQMVVTKRNRMTDGKGKSVKKSNFNYSLNEKNLLLMDELVSYITQKKIVPGVGTVHELKERPDTSKLNPAKERKRPINIKKHSIVSFNGRRVWA